MFDLVERNGGATLGELGEVPQQQTPPLELAVGVEVQPLYHNVNAGTNWSSIAHQSLLTAITSTCTLLKSMN